MIGFAGLTHLGIVSSAAVAAKGFKVVGFDPDPMRVADMAEGRLPVSEPGLDALVAEHRSLLRYENDLAALGQCDVVYISTDVPTDDHGQSFLGAILDLIERVLPVLRDEAVLVVLCQVPPGFTRTVKRAPDRLYYQVETLVFGRAVERALQPERYIIGCADPTLPLPPAYAELLNAFGCPILPMRYESAELTKIAINCCLAASITVANTLGELAERIGADWSEIAPALKLDRRIGEHAYLAPGLGIAGGNIERDLATVLQLSVEVGSEASVIAAYLRNSVYARDWALRVLHREVLSRTNDPVLAVLGLAYKENTQSTKNSPSIALLKHLQDFQVRLYDPQVPASAAAHPYAHAAISAEDALAGADALLVMTPWPAFRHTDCSAMRGRTIIDPYGVMQPRVGFSHFRIGARA